MSPFHMPAPTLDERVPPREGEPAWEEADGRTWREIALGLVEVDRARAHRQDGWRCRDIAQYAQWEHGFTPAQTAEVLRIGRKLLDLPEIDSAFCEGRLTWEHVVLLTRAAVPKHELGWLALALHAPLEELARVVERSAEGWAPPVVENSQAEWWGAPPQSDADTFDAPSSSCLPRSGILAVESVLWRSLGAGRRSVASRPGPRREYRAPNVRQPARERPSTS
jgi:hypothetical protein